MESSKKPSHRGSQVGTNQKPNVQINLNQGNLPRNGPQTKSIEHITPTSAPSALLMGSAGISQTTSMRVSPDFSIPSNLLSGTVMKKGTDISKSFKVVNQ